MIRRSLTWLEKQLAESEGRGICLVPKTRKESRILKQAVDEGLAVEVVPSLYALESSWREFKTAHKMRFVMRTLQGIHPDWVFAGPSAAVAYGLSVSNRYLEKVWVASSRKAHSKELDYRRSIIVPMGDATEIDGIRLTPLARTVGDCLRVMDFRSGLAVVDSVLRAHSFSRDDLKNDVAAACARMPGLTRFLPVVDLADSRAESGGESIARATMLELGIALPDLQKEVEDPIELGLAYRIDFAWCAGRKYILGELDGGEKYVSVEMRGDKSLSQVIDGEHRRQSHLEANEDVLRFIRFGFSDILDDKKFLELLVGCGVPRTYAFDERVVRAGGILRCRT